MVLSQVEPGHEVILKAICGGGCLRSRLYSMGLSPGTKLRVLNQGKCGPIMLRVRDCNLAMGRGMAEKITVE
jgi:ferrous iron transport protein A